MATPSTKLGLVVRRAGSHVLPFYGIAMMTCGLAAGIVGLIAVIQRSV